MWKKLFFLIKGRDIFLRQNTNNFYRKGDLIKSTYSWNFDIYVNINCNIFRDESGHHLLAAKWARHSALFLNVNPIVAGARNFNNVGHELDVVAEVARYSEIIDVIFIASEISEGRKKKARLTFQFTV